MHIFILSTGNQQYNADQVVTLDGSGSSDPDNIAPLVFQWTCASFFDSTVPCNADLPSDPTISVDAAELGHGMLFHV